MGRRRKRDKDLPPRVYLRHGAYYFVDHGGRWHHLGRDKREALRRYADVATVPQAVSLGAWMDRYLREIVPRKGQRTQRDNAAEMERLRSVFGDMLPDEVRPGDIYRYIDARGAPTRANREIALLSHLYTQLIRWEVVEHNPCRGIERNRERPRQRYVTDEEFWAVHDIAAPVLQLGMRLAVLTGVRLGRMLSLRREHVTDDGLMVPATKGGRPLLVEWTPELRDVVDGLERLRAVASVYLVARRDGQPYTRDGWQSMWTRTRDRALAEGLIAEPFSWHDLRAKAGSEAGDEELLGHQDMRVLRRHYQRAPRRVRPNRVER
ncbi:tyrosine-type recombinase/integrase [Halorhodospira neutriphila]|uniref:tyrosine-type recombinase/integrase n=1 Tax=Halorhodospira neutriphila TaxID=168379 RepID=UPI001908E29C|nr:tyrosine-type recombinase/integrase [Halorhodospira neutriphila]